MKSYPVEIYIEDENEMAHKQGRERHVKAADIDQAYAQVAKLLEQEPNLPPVRTMNVRQDGKIVVFLGHKSQAPAPEGLRHAWKRPPGPTRL